MVTAKDTNRLPHDTGKRRTLTNPVVSLEVTPQWIGPYCLNQFRRQLGVAYHIDHLVEAQAATSPPVPYQSGELEFGHPGPRVACRGLVNHRRHFLSSR